MLLDYSAKRLQIQGNQLVYNHSYEKDLHYYMM